jgi:hypothetical protein
MTPNSQAKILISGVWPNTPFAERIADAFKAATDLLSYWGYEAAHGTASEIRRSRRIRRSPGSCVLHNSLRTIGSS